ncbi:MAG: hypothetical protein JWL64_1881 [Frankiales bacterium]|nr:hypothetical protein [Frankiales bacterium]
MESFFEPLGDATPGRESRWLATAHTAGPWDAGAQHGGPPSALLARAIERTDPREDTMVARVTVEILGPIPVGELTLTSRVARPGRRVELVEAALSAGGREVARASGWRIARTGSGPDQKPPPLPPPIPDATGPIELGDWGQGGYLAAVDWRLLGGPDAGTFVRPGPGAAWTRLLVTLVADEEASPLQRVVAVADSGNGLSGELPVAGWHFINPELTVHVHREAVGEWVLLDARTDLSAGGVGLATSVLSDQRGPVGVGAQALLVAPR